MNELLNSLLENSTFPMLTALILGLMTAISPCPLATNITAIGFIGKDIEDKNKVFISGLIYTFGRIFGYTGLAAVLVMGADMFSVSSFFQQNGEKILGPLMIIIGIFMLDVIKIYLPSSFNFFKYFEKRNKSSYINIFILGVVFALAFCPYSGVLYFGMLIPLTTQSSTGLILPAIFALATGIPVIIFAWLLAFTVSGVGKFYNRIKTFEKWFRKIVGVLFIIFGLYYLLTVGF